MFLLVVCLELSDQFGKVFDVAVGSFGFVEIRFVKKGGEGREV